MTNLINLLDPHRPNMGRSDHYLHSGNKKPCPFRHGAGKLVVCV